MGELAFLFVAAFVAPVLFVLVTLDRLIARLRTVHFDAWAACGKPQLISGGRLLPANVDVWEFWRWYMSTLRAIGCLVVWFFHTPRWAKSDAKARRMLVVIRIGLAALVALQCLLSGPALQRQIQALHAIDRAAPLDLRRMPSTSGD